MANFSNEMAKALKLITNKQAMRASRSALKKQRPLFNSEIAKYMKDKLKLDRSVGEIEDRISFKNPSPKEINGHIVDQLYVDKARFSFLDFPHKIVQRRRKDGSISTRRVMTAVNIGRGFQAYKGIFVENIKGSKELALRRKDPNRPEPLSTRTRGNRGTTSMEMNAFAAIALNQGKFEASTDDYVNGLLKDLGKRMIRAMYRKVNKKVKFKLSKG